MMSETGTELDLFQPQNAVTILTSDEEFDRFYERIKEAVAEFEPDTGTATGRKAIASLAHRVTKTKTFLDGEGKRLNEEARAKINKVDASRRRMRQSLDQLHDEVRQPLTDWEETEEARQRTVDAKFQHFHTASLVVAGEASTEIEDRLRNLRTEKIDADIFRERQKEADESLAEAIERLEAALECVKQEEADRAELDRLRAEQEERERREAEERRAEEERKRREAEEKAAAERAAQEEADRKEREEAAARRAAEEAQRKAEQEAEEERRRVHEQHEAELRQEREERERLEREDAARRADEERRAEEQRRREADREHRSVVMRTAKEAVMQTIEIDEAKARELILAIAAREIPNVRIEF